MVKTLFSFFLFLQSSFAHAAPIVENWKVIHEAFFNGREVREAKEQISIQAPEQAEDASLVPFAFKADFASHIIQKIYLFTDANPILHTATFFPASNTQQFSVSTRIRLEKNSVVRVIAETQEGTLWMAQANIRTPGGGCGGGGYSDEAQLRESAGKMKLRHQENTQFAFNIKHPMRTGFERTAQGYFAKAWYINHLSFKNGDLELLKIEVGPGISADPYFLFSTQQVVQTIWVEAKDNEDKVFQQNFIFD
ncbi:MAG TPA: quinoprotein dehydrogenase-associated SoxYZ-like carrier [Methylotenera sp.]|nr:quinoprotein dehydrogenase-associated SoxYZ-like carrier [Methylotenera sp.]HPH06550.1 quinoprotein dehydrogenase-associated SoxYZ-like carrier [Methylotenera sp.]HPN01808.1 quinoprotein dehydrogenase-associated SoxYZ-like carrier [Methylotenera sp.]